MAERVDTMAGITSERLNASVGLLGGTGELGTGLARRLAPVVREVMIGSRDVGRARTTAAGLGHGTVGVTNSQACAADFVVVAVPWQVHDEVLAAVAERLSGRVVIDAVNPLGFDERGAFALRVAAGSAVQRAQELLPASRVVGAFHHVPASRLSSTDALDMDVLVVGDDQGAVAAVCELVDLVAGLRGVYAGRLRNAGQVEAMTANLISINRRYRAHSGLRVTGL